MKKIVGILCISLVLAGCGPRILYPHLDWLIPWYMNDYFSLNSRQSSYVKESIRQQLRWHCSTQLKNYARWLRELQRERAFALVFATHSERLARGCDSLARLENGRLHALDERQMREYFDGLGV